jgi:Family of unknown function (DUF6496)
MAKQDDKKWFAKEKQKKIDAVKVPIVMREFKAGNLHSGSAKGPIVKDKAQAIAIALSYGKRGKK